MINISWRSVESMPSYNKNYEVFRRRLNFIKTPYSLFIKLTNKYSIFYFILCFNITSILNNCIIYLTYTLKSSIWFILPLEVGGSI